MKKAFISSVIYGLLLAAGAIFSIQGCNSTKTEEDSVNTTETIPTAPDTASAAMPETTTTRKAGVVNPKGAKPAWAPNITPEMQAVIEKLASFGGKPIESLNAKEARKQPTPTDAVMALIQENDIPVPPMQVDTMGKKIPVSGGQNIHLRIYTPKAGKGSFPVIVYYHGGGWVIADIDTYDASARALAEQVKAVVVSVGYRMGPENKFPIPHFDSYAAYEWVLKNARSIKGDPKRIAVVGESAGGNLAANMSIMARDKKAMMPLHQVLVYPIANNDMNSPSYTKFADAKPLNKAMMAWFVKNALPSPATADDPRFSLVNANLTGLPPTTIITAEIDPLLNDGEMLADKMRTAGVATTQKTFMGVTHEFFGMAAVLPEAKEAQAMAADVLKKAFNKEKAR